MKSTLSILLLLLSSFSCFAQDIDECQKIVDLTAQAISDKSSSALELHLADDFSIAEQEGPIAKIVLSQLFSQLNETVTAHEFIAKESTAKGLLVRYNFNYAEMGEKEALFEFNAKNQLVELSLFKMEVKRMDELPEVETNAANVIDIGFTQKGNLISVKVDLNGKERNFLLDSGAPTLVLNAKYVERKNDGDDRVLSGAQGVNGEISGMDIVAVESINFSGIRLNDQQVIAVDLSHLEKELETEIYGLIGYDMIKGYDVLFDYDNKTITLIQPEYFSTYKKDKLADYEAKIVQLEMAAHIPVVEMQIGKNRLLMGIDCGAESNLFDDDNVKSLKRYSKNCGTDQLLGAGDEKGTTIRTCEVIECAIDDQKFAAMESVFSDISHLNDGYSIQLDGLIGYQILSRQKTLLSFSRKELIFLKKGNS